VYFAKDRKLVNLISFRDVTRTADTLVVVRYLISDLRDRWQTKGVLNSKAVLTSISTAVVNVNHRPVVVGVDGQSGSGKSTLAAELAQSLSASSRIVHGDDFYGEMSTAERELLGPEEGYARYFDWRRLESQVLMHIRDSAAALRYQQYDWHMDALGPWFEISMPEVVIVEGVYTLRPELRKYFDITVFVRASQEARLRRQISRGENSMFWIDRWTAAEDFYVATMGPWEWVDFLISGE
jgi:uridine kinase